MADGFPDIQSQVSALSLEIGDIRGQLNSIIALLSQRSTIKQDDGDNVAIGTPSATSPTREAVNMATMLNRDEVPKRRLDYDVSQRRTSLWDPMGAQQYELEKPAMVFSQPEYSGRLLETLEYNDVMAFLDDVRRFQAGTKIQVPVGRYISKSLQNRLLTKSDGLLNPANFYSADFEFFYKVFQRVLRPESILSFLEVLKKNTSFPWESDRILKPTGLEAFYDALLEYAHGFSTLFRFLAERNEVNTPEISSKEGGVVKLFLSKVPFQYGARVLQSMGKNSFDSLDSFMDSFMGVAKKHRDVSNAMKEVMAHFVFAPSDRNQQHANKANQQGQGQRFNRGGLNIAVETTVENESPPVESQPLLAMEPYRPANKQPLHHHQPAQKAGLARSNKNEMGCYRAIYYNTCDSVSCNFNHDEHVLCKTWKELYDLLMKSNYKPERMHAMLAEIIDPGEESGDIIERELDEIHENLLCALPEVSLHSAVNIPGELIVGDEVIKLPARDILFDSGATHASYISSEFFEENMQLMGPIAKFMKGRTTVGNGVVVNTACVVPMHARFVDTDGKENTFAIDFQVLEGLPTKVVVGLPVIIRKALPLFCEMLYKAAEKEEQETGLLMPWRNGPFSVAPEEAECPDPCSFPDVLHFMTMSEEEAMDEYLSQIDQHVAPEFLAVPGVRELLESLGADVFIARDWTGINGLEPLELTWKSDLPESMKPRARFIHPSMFDNAKGEFGRLTGYFYRPSNSPIASCLVIAPKATKPFIRFCGDYVAINKYIERNQAPIPKVRHQLEKIAKFKIYLDIDLANAFHQIKLGPVTSRRLSVQTPWGQVEPLFLPEGVSPASGILHSLVSSIFADFEEFSICIFDNLLVLAHDYADALLKLELVLRRCKERNVFLKFSKTWLGFTKVTFFGYECSHDKYGLSDARKQAIKSFRMPRSQKAMQSFLGTSIFFQDFVPNFAKSAAPLHEMTHKDFNWDPSTWKRDYVGAFEHLKEVILAATQLYYPDYELEWILRADASLEGVGAVLFQCKPSADGEVKHQPIGFASKKFSDAATRWSTYEQEAYAIWFAVHHFEYFLRPKEFIVETDHNNLRWMENSAVPKVIRWRVYLQGFTFLVRHIPGRENVVADWSSRFFALADASEAPGDVKTILEKVHGARAGHHGERRTWALLNDVFPGHKIPYRVVADFVACCPICQKDRLGMMPMDMLPEIIRHHKVPHARHTVGVDTLTVTPADKFGNSYLIVVINLFTKFVSMYPAPDKSAETVARALLIHFASYGTFEHLVSDPGSEFMAEVVQQLNKWLGIQHVVSLVDRPQSSGVEHANKLILRHLRALVYDERLVHAWSDPAILSWIQLTLNSTNHSETNFTPYELTFGSKDALHFHLPEPFDSPDSSSAYLQRLNADLQKVRDASYEFQQKLARERTKLNPEIQTTFKPGDYVLLDNPDRVSKLQPRYRGPYEVLSQVKNDVEVRHLLRHNVMKLHVSKLKIFHGTREQAFKAAQLDSDEYEVDKFLAYRGDPLRRREMDFLVRFCDGSELWMPWSADLFQTVPYGVFCETHPELRPLLHTAKKASEDLRRLLRSAITEVSPGDIVYVDLRSYGAGWYDTLSIPDKYLTKYVLEYHYLDYDKDRTLIRCHCPVFDEYFIVDHDFVKRYGGMRSVPHGAVLIDKDFVAKYPELKPKLQLITARNIVLESKARIQLLIRF